MPSAELVRTVKSLYFDRSRNQDTRFLIPILSGLNKEVILSALVKVVALPQQMIRAAFQKYLPRSRLRSFCFLELAGWNGRGREGVAGYFIHVFLVVFLSHFGARRLLHSSRKPPFSAADLLVQLHFLATPDSPQLQQQAKNAILICFSDRKAFSQDVVAVVLNKLVCLRASCLKRVLRLCDLLCVVLRRWTTLPFPSS